MRTSISRTLLWAFILTLAVPVQALEVPDPSTLPETLDLNLTKVILVRPEAHMDNSVHVLLQVENHTSFDADIGVECTASIGGKVANRSGAEAAVKAHGDKLSEITFFGIADLRPIFTCATTNILKHKPGRDTETSH